MNGSDNVTINELLGIIRKSTPGTPKTINSVLHRIIDSALEFANGKAHDQNMKDMVAFYKDNFTDFT